MPCNLEKINKRVTEESQKSLARCTSPKHSPCPFYSTSFCICGTTNIYREGLRKSSQCDHHALITSPVSLLFRQDYWNSATCLLFVQTPYYSHMFLMLCFSTAHSNGSLSVSCQKHAVLTYVLCNFLLFQEVPHYLIHVWDQTSPLQLTGRLKRLRRGPEACEVVSVHANTFWGMKCHSAAPSSSASATRFVVSPTTLYLLQTYKKHALNQGLTASWAIKLQIALWHSKNKPQQVLKSWPGSSTMSI